MACSSIGASKLACEVAGIRVTVPGLNVRTACSCDSSEAVAEGGVNAPNHGGHRGGSTVGLAGSCGDSGLDDGKGGGGEEDVERERLL